MASQSQADLESRVNTLLGRTAWTNGWSSAASLSPPIVRASLSLASVPASKQYLDAKTRALVAIAVDSASTHLYVPGIQRHVRTALEAGATPAEVMEAIELTSTLGIHACNIGVPLLVEVMREEGGYEKYLGNKDGEGGEEVFDERREKLKKEFTEKRGYWHGFWEDFLRLDPEFFEAYLEFSTVPWTKGGKEGEEGRGVLEPKVKELMYCAFDAAATHLYVPGLKLHMRNVLRYGGKPEEIMEVLEIATLLSLHTIEVASPILAEAMQK